MKKIILIFALIFLIVVLCVSCTPNEANDNVSNDDKSNEIIQSSDEPNEFIQSSDKSNETQAPIQSSDKTNETQNPAEGNDTSTNLPPAIEIDDSRTFVKGFSWESFKQTINSGDVELNTAQKHTEILNISINISEHVLSSIDYTEYLDGDWELSIYWYPIKSVGIAQIAQTEICSFTAFQQDGYDSVGILRGYTLIDEENKIYVKELPFDRVSYICLINDKIFNRSSVPKSNPAYETAVEQLKSYMLEIKAAVNQDVMQ